MIRAALPSVTPGLGDVFNGAIQVLSHCADLVASTGCSPAAVYVAGAEGSLRHALTELTHRSVHLAGGSDDFEVQRIGSSEVVSMGGFPDTVRGCMLEDGSVGDVRALLQERRVERCSWMRTTGELGNVHVRGRVERTPDGCRFIDEPELESSAGQLCRPDLGRDIVASGLDLSARPSFAAALEVTLVAGSWVHVPTRARWYADPATARAVVRLAGGSPGVDARLVTRLGACVDRAVLLFVEMLGWRHWPTPSLGD